MKAALATLLSDEASAALEQLAPELQSALSVVLSAAQTSAKQHEKLGAPQAMPLLVRRLKTRPDEGPISGEAITNRMMAICGCKGQYDCDCVSVQNLARMELWYLHNAGHEDPDRFRRRGTSDTSRDHLPG
jgi:hypothetical protein